MNDPLHSKAVAKTFNWNLPALAGCVVATLLVYLPGLSGGFVFDDFANIVYNPRLQMIDLSVPQLFKAALSGESGLLGRPLSMLSFALNLHGAGLDPRVFKVTNLVIHLVNGVSIYVLTALLLEAHRRSAFLALSDSDVRWVGVAVAAAWLVHPLNLTGVLYIVQRMTSLAALFTLWGLILYTWGRLRLVEGKTGGIIAILVGLLVCGPLATLAKENGALLPLYMFVVEFVLFRFRSPTSGVRYFLVGLFGLSVAVPALAVLGSLWNESGAIRGGYGGREFTLPERLMTEARVLWFYVEMIGVPNIANLGMYHDDIAVSRGLLNPVTTLFAVLGWVVLLITAVWARRRAPVACLGLLFFLAGHSMESSVIPLEIAHEHRNYLPSFGLLMLLFYYLLHGSRLVRTTKLRRLAAFAFVVLCALNTATRASQWSNPLMMSIFESEDHPYSPRTSYEAGRAFSILLEHHDDDHDQALELYEKAKSKYENALALKPDMTEAYVALITMSFVNRQPVDPVWLDELRGQLQSLVIGPSMSGALSALFLCKAKNICQLTDDYMESIILAVTHNSKRKRRSTAILFTVFADFYRGVNDQESAADFLRRAMIAAPYDVTYRITYAEQMASMGEYGEVRKQLAAIDAADRFGSYDVRIERLRSSLQ